MAMRNTDCYMPIEMLDLIAAADEQSYRAMLAVPLFARSQTPGKIVDFMIGFGYSVRITEDYIEWFLNGDSHRVDGPAIEFEGGDKEWYLNDELHRIDSPAIEYANGDKIWCLSGTKRVDGRL
jgi:hypothetical protein